MAWRLRHLSWAASSTLTDGRIHKTGVSIFRGSKSVTTTSFNPVTLEFRGCSGHQEKKIWKDRASQEGHRQVIQLTNQCYPAVLPAHGSAMCMKIIRREYGSLNQLAAELMDLARGKIIEKESMVLIFSGTHLARVGTVAYTEDLTAAVAAIKSVIGCASTTALPWWLWEQGGDKKLC
jgi:hypothetical protein